MTFDWKHIVLILIIGAIGMGWGLTKCSDNSQLKSETKTANDNLNLYTACVKVKTRVTVIRSSYPVLYPDSIFTPAKPVTITKTDTSCNSSFSQPFNYGRLSFRLTGLIHNCYPYQMGIHELKNPVDTVKECTVMDTCINKPPVTVDLKRSMYGVYFGTNINSLSYFPQYQVGIFWFYKKYGFIAPAWMYDARQGRSFFTLNIGINLRK
jgi:hypothetical protein